MEKSDHDIIPRGYSNDTGMTFFLERVHSIFIMCFSAFLNDILLPYKSFQCLFWMKLTCSGMKFKHRKSYSTVLTLFSESELIKKGISSGKWGAIPVMQPETKTYIHSFILHCNQTLHVAR